MKPRVLKMIGAIRVVSVWVTVVIGLFLLTADSAHAQLFTSNLQLNFVAEDPSSGIDNANWDSLTVDQTWNMDFTGSVSLVNVSPTYRSFTEAYSFDGGYDVGLQSFNGIYGDGSATTWELWLKPDDTGVSGPQIIFETGGGAQGSAIYYDPGTLNDGTGTIHFTIDDGANFRDISATISSSDFTHITAVADSNYSGTLDLTQLYVNGVLATDNSLNADTLLNDYAGANGSAFGYTSQFGNTAQPVANGPTEIYRGDVAVFRVWDTALTAAQISANYSVYDTTPALTAATLTVSNGDFESGGITDLLGTSPSSNDNFAYQDYAAGGDGWYSSDYQLVSGTGPTLTGSWYADKQQDGGTGERIRGIANIITDNQAAKGLVTGSIDVLHQDGFWRANVYGIMAIRLLLITLVERG